MNDPAFARLSTPDLYHLWERARESAPAAQTTIAIEDWEVMFDAVVETLCGHAKEWLAEPDAEPRGLAGDARTRLLECVKALCQLKGALVLEADRPSGGGRVDGDARRDVRA